MSETSRRLSIWSRPWETLQTGRVAFDSRSLFWFWFLAFDWLLDKGANNLDTLIKTGREDSKVLLLFWFWFLSSDWLPNKDVNSFDFWQPHVGRITWSNLQSPCEIDVEVARFRRPPNPLEVWGPCFLCSYCSPPSCSFCVACETRALGLINALCYNMVYRALSLMCRTWLKFQNLINVPDWLYSSSIT